MLKTAAIALTTLGVRTFLVAIRELDEAMSPLGKPRPAPASLRLPRR